MTSLTIELTIKVGKVMISVNTVYICFSMGNKNCLGISYTPPPCIFIVLPIPSNRRYLSHILIELFHIPSAYFFLLHKELSLIKAYVQFMALCQIAASKKGDDY